MAQQRAELCGSELAKVKFDYKLAIEKDPNLMSGSLFNRSNKSEMQALIFELWGEVVYLRGKSDTLAVTNGQSGNGGFSGSSGSSGTGTGGNFKLGEDSHGDNNGSSRSSGSGTGGDFRFGKDGDNNDAIFRTQAAKAKTLGDYKEAVSQSQAATQAADLAKGVQQRDDR
jgi:hypothetical protein